MMAPDPSAQHSLYLCYFGLREPLVQTQVLPYLRELRAGGVRVSLLTFEADLRRSWPEAARAEWQARLRAEGIHWKMLPYHKRPSVPATLYDVWAGSRLAARLAREERVDVLHARGHVAAAIGALAKRATGSQLLFDIRGFMPEEYVDAGAWPKDGWLFHLVKRAERSLLRAADGFVVLTERAREILFGDCVGYDRHGRPIAVIPCCVDHERFAAHESVERRMVRHELGVSDRKVLTYVGALGGWYLTEDMADFLAVAHREDPATFSLILTQSDPDLIRKPLQERGVALADVLVRRVPASEIPRYLKAADVAISFIKPCYSKLSSSPTKLAEYLASGLPVVCNAGIGDVDEVLRRHRVGVLIDSLHPEAYVRALAQAESLQAEADLADRCRRCARQEFDLTEVGGTRYRQLYHRLRARREAARGETGNKGAK